MDILLMILYATIILAILVFIHEGGHYLAAKAFGVRVTEFMIGLPGPSIGFKWRGTRFGVTAVPLGGYARICGMEGGDVSPHLEDTLALVYRRGVVLMEDAARELGITDDEAYAALDQLSEWGSIAGPTKKDQFNTYRAPQTKEFAEGDPREVADPHALYESEYKQQYRSLPFWKRSIILLAGVIVNLLFVFVLFILIFSIIGVPMVHPETGEAITATLNPLQAIGAAGNFIATIFNLIAGLFNPATAAATVEQSTSIMGIAVASKTMADRGIADFLFFMANISVSLGLMNLLPIPPLDGGRFVVELFQKISRKIVTPKVMGYLSAGGLVLFVGFFLFMLNQDIQRFIFGNW